MIDWRPLGIRPARFLLPAGQAMGRLWPVIALDQYTSQPEIWQEAERQIGRHPSTLRLVVPEAFLQETEARSRAATACMRQYLDEGVLTPMEEGFILVERQTQSGRRIGLVAAIDLEAYDYRPGSRSMIRATEETVLDRIPPRLAVREQAPIELSHVMLLVDDPEDLALGPLYAGRDSLPMVYDLDLLMQGGHIRGWLLRDARMQRQLADALAKMKAALREGALLYAVGDGNHSLAAAKAGWEKIKPALSEAEREAHPARFAMVELVNLHSPALIFEPIHRVVFGQDQAALLRCLAPLGPIRDEAAPHLTLAGAEGNLPLRLSLLPGQLVLAAVQPLLDAAKYEIDYVHGEEAAREVALRRRGVGIILPAFRKDQLFPAVQRDGRLPRKTFSMGEANEKRFYLEARYIR